MQLLPQSIMTIIIIIIGRITQYLSAVSHAVVVLYMYWLAAVAMAVKPNATVVANSVAVTMTVAASQLWSIKMLFIALTVTTKIKYLQRCCFTFFGDQFDGVV